MDEWQEVEGQLITWKDPKEVVGEYRGFVERSSKYKEGEVEKKHTVYTDDFETVSFFAPTLLARMLESVSTGERIKIVMTGETLPSKKGNPAKVFKLYKSSGEVVPA